MVSVDEVAHLRDKLETLRPDGKLFGVLPSLDTCDRSVNDWCTDVQLKEFKAHKDSFLEGETRKYFLEGCLEKETVALQERMSCSSRDLVAERRETKRRNQALNLERTRVAEEHDRLRKQAAELRRDETEMFEECQKSFRILSDVVDEKALDDVWRNGSHASEAMLSALGNSSRNDTVDEALKAKQEQPQRLAKIRRLEDELRAIKQETDRVEMLDIDLEKKIALEKQEISRLEDLASIHELLGVQRITWDDKENTVILGQSSHGIEYADLALRTVKVEYHDDGRLKCAEPHHVLGLWNEASKAVEKDDLAFLLTLVWDRLRGQQQQQQNWRAGVHHGGADAMLRATELGGA
jgi:hypothetical protein